MVQQSNEEVCANCKFVFLSPDAIGARIEHHFCRRYPAVVYKNAKDWCGEWKPDEE